MSTPARKRLMRDFKRLQQDPPAGTFKLTLQFSEDYTNKPPTVRFVSRMFHPNICAGSICLDILQNQWSPMSDVAAILTSIQAVEKVKNSFPMIAWGLADTTFDDAFIKVSKGAHALNSLLKMLDC